MRKVNLIYLHTPLFHPNVGAITEAHLNDSRSFKKLEMFEDGDCIKVTCVKDRKPEATFYIPKANVKLYTVEPTKSNAVDKK